MTEKGIRVYTFDYGRQLAFVNKPEPAAIDSVDYYSLIDDHQLAELKQEIWDAAREWEVVRLVPVEKKLTYKDLSDYESKKDG